MIAARLFGGVHRRVGVLDQLGGIGAVVRINGDAEDAGMVRLVPATSNGLLRVSRMPRRPTTTCSACCASSREIRDDKLVAAEARHHIVLTNSLLQAGRRPQHGVAGIVAKAIVVILKKVEIDKQHRDAALSAAALYRLFQLGAEQQTVLGATLTDRSEAICTARWGCRMQFGGASRTRVSSVFW